MIIFEGTPNRVAILLTKFAVQKNESLVKACTPNVMKMS